MTKDVGTEWVRIAIEGSEQHAVLAEARTHRDDGGKACGGHQATAAATANNSNKQSLKQARHSLEIVISGNFPLTENEETAFSVRFSLRRSSPLCSVTHGAHRRASVGNLFKAFSFVDLCASQSIA